VAEPARETLSVLFVSQAARRAPEPAFTKFQLNGGRRILGCKSQTVFVRKHRLRPVRARA
jgi:hypothetical protein